MHKTTVTKTTTTTTTYSGASNSPKKSLNLAVYVVIDTAVLPATADSLETKPFIELAEKIRNEARKFGVTFVVNDRVDVALAVDADGVHLGQDDMPLVTARALLGPTKIIGITCATSAQVIEACSSHQADYLGTCAVFPTTTKSYDSDFVPLGTNGLRELLAISTLPVVAIGGINESNVETLIQESRHVDGSVVAGCAVVSAVICATNPELATRALAAKITPIVSKLPAITLQLNSRSPRVQTLVNQIANALASIRRTTPLVHSITNYVVMNDNANIILAIGGSPIMAHSIDEAADIVSFCGSLVLNIGTLSNHWIQAMHIAGKKANEIGIPVVLDPVGAGATPLRQKTCTDLATLVHADIIKGNAGEISFLAGALAGHSGGAQSRGVDSDGSVSEPSRIVRSLAGKIGSVIAMSGPVDYIADREGKDVVTIQNGNEWLGKITGTGCDTTTMVAAFAAALAAELAGGEKSAARWTSLSGEDGGFDPYLVAAVGGILCMCIAAEQAVAQPGVTALFDAVANLTPEMVQRHARIDLA
ncbi:Hydroxyethylthiazole kinase family-domain-containing protein [Obelidium mucronatum]|nr:Hydroxyethylthiazole kinase family-domain-containing protein [Obelidium mucronatum]